MDKHNQSQSDEDDNIPQLSAATLQALQEFYKEQEEFTNSRSCQLENVGGTTADTTEMFENDLNTNFPEDWQMSQFWYDDSTSDYLANLVKNLAGSTDDKIACISCPSVFRACGFSENIHLFEYDKRFGAFGSTYYFYDYNFPENMPTEIIGTYTVIIADPPFLSEECLEKVSITVKKLLKPGGKIILCTGAVMENKAGEYLGLKKTSFEPTHKKNLGNLFACFTNFDLENLIS